MNRYDLDKEERKQEEQVYFQKMNLYPIHKNNTSALSSSKIIQKQEITFCQYCGNTLSYVQYNNHFELCKKRSEDQQYKNEILQQRNDLKQLKNEEQIEQQKYNYFGSQEHKEANQKQNAMKQLEIKEKQQDHQIQVKTQEIQQQQKIEFHFEEQIYCPHCSKHLSLNELDHIQMCNTIGPCIYCKQTYPIELLSLHLQNCEKRLARVVQILQQQEQQIKIFQLLKKEKYIKQKINQDYFKEFTSTMAKKAQRRMNQHLGYHRWQLYQNEMYNERERQQYYDPRNYEKQNYLKDYEGLSLDMIDELGVDIYMKKDKEDEDCSVCMIGYKQQDQIVRLPCFHVFHYECIVPWLKMKAWCPTCKVKIQS